MATIKLIGFWVLFILIFSAGCGDTKPATSGPSPHRINDKGSGKNNFIVQWFDQTLDHTNSTDTRTFKQRYVVESKFAKDLSSPTIYYVCGEGNCMDGELDGWVVTLAEKMSAHLVALEHRYYGQSQPFDLMTGDNFKYLSIEQALEDLATFEKWVVKTQNFTGKWIAIGGSYPADLAALYRMKYPTLASGAIASSACPRFDQDSFLSDKIAAKDVGLSCTAKFRTEVLLKVQAALGNPQAMNPIKKLFDAEDIADDLDFLGALSGMSIVMVQYGGKKQFCDSLNDPSPMEAYAKEMAKLLKNWSNTRLINWSYTGNMDPHSTLYEKGFGFRQWIYQACTEEGVYTAGVMKANPDETESLSSKLTDPLPAKYCEVYFGIQPPPNLDEMNTKYYEPLLDPATTSNILFVSGNNDPACFAYAIARENGNDTNPNTVTYTVDGGTHCQDLQQPNAKDSESLKKARDLELELATKWSQLN